MAQTGYQINLLEVPMWGRRTSHKTADCSIHADDLVGSWVCTTHYLPPCATSPFLPTLESKKKKSPQVPIVLSWSIGCFFPGCLSGEDRIKRARESWAWAKLFCVTRLSSGALPKARIWELLCKSRVWRDCSRAFSLGKKIPKYYSWPTSNSLSLHLASVSGNYTSYHFGPIKGISFPSVLRTPILTPITLYCNCLIILCAVYSANTKHSKWQWLTACLVNEWTLMETVVMNPAAHAESLGFESSCHIPLCTSSLYFPNLRRRATPPSIPKPVGPQGKIISPKSDT